MSALIAGSSGGFRLRPRPKITLPVAITGRMRSITGGAEAGLQRVTGRRLRPADATEEGDVEARARLDAQCVSSSRIWRISVTASTDDTRPRRRLMTHSTSAGVNGRGAGFAGSTGFSSTTRSPWLRDRHALAGERAVDQFGQAVLGFARLCALIAENIATRWLQSMVRPTAAQSVFAPVIAPAGEGSGRRSAAKDAEGPSGYPGKGRSSNPTSTKTRTPSSSSTPQAVAFGPTR